MSDTDPSAPHPPQQRLLLVHPAVLVELAKAAEPVRLHAACHALPRDTKFVDVFVGPDIAGHVMMIVESAEFGAETPNPLRVPHLVVVPE